MAMSDLEAQVKQNTDVEASAVALIQGLAQKLADAGTNKQKLDALQAELNASAGSLAAAVAANTPVDNTQASPAPSAPGQPGVTTPGTSTNEGSTAQPGA